MCARNNNKKKIIILLLLLFIIIIILISIIIISIIIYYFFFIIIIIIIIKYYCYLIRIIITQLESALRCFPAATARFLKNFHFPGLFIVTGSWGQLLLLRYSGVWLQPGAKSGLGNLMPHSCNKHFCHTSNEILAILEGWR